MSEDCPSEDDLLACVEGRLAADRRAALEVHVDRCPACRSELAALSQVIGPPDLTAPADTLERIGRYILLSRIGAGAMGVVYAAYDPELDRKVAVKVLHRHTGPAAQGRLLREAHALARLAHPNIVTVFDAGTIGGRVFMAMEFVRGATLAAWRTAHPRRWQDTVALFLQAGHGLAAAHAGGFVHRDFKPDNVLVGDDGRARVSDFGLASTGDEAIEDSLLDLRVAGPLVAGPLTRDGEIVGTPAYMAPEQFLGLAVDARTDQFAFCVALHEALFGRHPFLAGDSFAALKAAVLAGQPSRGPTGRVPARIVRAIRRGLRVAPDDRYPDMHALLAALEQTPTRTRWLVAAAGVAVAAGLVLRSDAGSVCRVDRLADAWSDERAAAVEQALTVAPGGAAAGVGPRTRTVMQAWADTWRAAYRDACEATHVRGDQSSALLDLRMRCLERHRMAFVGLTEVLLAADADVVRTAVQASRELPRLDACTDADSLRAERPLPDDPDERARIAEAHQQLARGRAMLDAGRYRDAVPFADAALATGEALGYRPLAAEALLLRAELHERQVDLPAARRSAREAVWAAEAGNVPRVAAQAWLLQATHAAGDEGWAAALDLARHADMILERIGGDPEIAAVRSVRLARAAWTLRDFPRSVALAEAAVEQLRAVHGPTSPRVAAALNTLGAALFAAHRSEEALAAYASGLAIARAALGPHHPTVAVMMTNLGEVQHMTGRTREGLHLHAEALAIARATLGPDHPTLAAILHNLGRSWAALGHSARALDLYARALAVATAALGEDHGFVAELHIAVARHARALGSLARARLHAARGLATMRSDGEVTRSETLDALAVLAAAHQDAGDDAAAAALLDEGLAALARPGMVLIGDGARILQARRARGWLRHGDAAQAAALLGPAPAGDRPAPAVEDLARAELLTSRDPPRARIYARRAEATARLASDRPIFEAAATWLHAHPEDPDDRHDP